MNHKNTCQKCGDCCRAQKIPINLLDIFNISAHLKLTPDEFVQKYLKLTKDKQGEKTYIIKQSPCPFLKNSLCSIHETKPITCKITPCPKNPKYNEFKRKYGATTLNFLTNTKKDMLTHFLSEEYTEHYLETHKKFKQATAQKYRQKIEKDLKNKPLARHLLKNIIKLSVYPRFQAQIAEKAEIINYI